MIGDGSNRRTIIYIADVCNAARVAAEHPAAGAQIYNVTDGRVHTIREIVEAISGALGKRAPRMRLPTGPARLAAGYLEDGLRLLGRRSPVGRALVDKFVEDIAVSGNKMQQQLGYVPNYDLATGWAKTVSKMNHLYRSDE
jgi:UDP-glucose 4-epimerase